MDAFSVIGGGSALQVSVHRCLPAAVGLLGVCRQRKIFLQLSACNVRHSVAGVVKSQKARESHLMIRAQYTYVLAETTAITTSKTKMVSEMYALLISKLKMCFHFRFLSMLVYA